VGAVPEADSERSLCAISPRVEYRLLPTTTVSSLRVGGQGTSWGADKLNLTSEEWPFRVKLRQRRKSLVFTLIWSMCHKDCRSAMGCNAGHRRLAAMNLCCSSALNIGDDQIIGAVRTTDTAVEDYGQTHDVPPDGGLCSG
jgi:hypothetical protein